MMSNADVVQSLNKTRNWGLSAETSADYAAFLDRANLTVPIDPETLLCHYHNDHVLVLAFNDSRHRDHLAAVDCIKTWCLQTIHQNRYCWVTDTSLTDEDVCQSVLATICASIHKFEYRSAFRTWVTSLVINESRQIYRKNTTQSRKGVAETLDDHAEIAQDQPAVEDIAIHKAMLDSLEQCLKECKDPRLLIVFRMYVHKQATLKEIGEELNLSASRVHAFLKSVREFLREQLKNEDTVE